MARKLLPNRFMASGVGHRDTGYSAVARRYGRGEDGEKYIGMGNREGIEKMVKRSLGEHHDGNIAFRIGVKCLKDRDKNRMISFPPSCGSGTYSIALGSVEFVELNENHVMVGVVLAVQVGKANQASGVCLPRAVSVSLSLVSVPSHANIFTDRDEEWVANSTALLLL
ncbi:hypothetical protein RRG08_020576 [Elysia crispata]|uniref:Uncharacterized protein n=1 Tax=Elysia crispata TaxID=231223 RepID=A0AAE1A6C0_9GAST|nr:hypothetical protein RRG08_020576 [Elysia crispata]